MAELFCSVSSCSTLLKSSRTRSKTSLAVRSEMALLPEHPCSAPRNWRGRKTSENSPLSPWQPRRLPSLSHSRWFALLPPRMPARFAFLDAAGEQETASRSRPANGRAGSARPHHASFAPSDRSHSQRTIPETPFPSLGALPQSFPHNSGKFRPALNSAIPRPVFLGSQATPPGNESPRESSRPAPVQAGGETRGLV